jgi:hypothetical protein
VRVLRDLRSALHGSPSASPAMLYHTRLAPVVVMRRHLIFRYVWGAAVQSLFRFSCSCWILSDGCGKLLLVPIVPDRLGFD